MARTKARARYALDPGRSAVAIVTPSVLSERAWIEHLRRYLDKLDLAANALKMRVASARKRRVLMHMR